jgi:D-amino-acid dehydrogenase
MAERRHIGVIGAGIVGIAAASYLQRDGHQVFLLDTGNPGEGASYGNAGCFNLSSIVPMSTPGIIRDVPRWLMDPLGPLSIRWRYMPTLLPWLIRLVRAGGQSAIEAQARALRALLVASLDDMMTLAVSADAADLIQCLGTLIVYRSQQSFAKATLATELRQANGVEMEHLDADQLRQLEPSISPTYARGTLIRENGHTSNPLRLVQRLAEAFARNGGIIRQAQAVGFALEGQRLRAIRTDRGDFPADGAIIAAGAFSAPLAASLGDVVPLETQRGYHVMIHDAEAMPRIAVNDADGKFAATPMETGLRVAGTVELAGLRPPPDWRRARILLQQARTLFPALAAEYPEERLSLWMGHRPSTPDSLPVLGPARRSPDVVYAFGHSHIGLAAAGTTGRIVADLLGNRPPRIDIAPFRADRF